MTIAGAVCVGTALAAGPALGPQPGFVFGPAYSSQAYSLPGIQAVAYASPRIQYALPSEVVASVQPTYTAAASLPNPAPRTFPYAPTLKFEATAPVVRSARPAAVAPFGPVPLVRLATAPIGKIAAEHRIAYPPQPYSFGYELTDEYGTKQTRQESSDANNAKTGSYGFTDARGVFRQVNYVADADGFRASISTNEPGTAPSAPASVVYSAHADNAALAAVPVAKLVPRTARAILANPAKSLAR